MTVDPLQRSQPPSPTSTSFSPSQVAEVLRHLQQVDPNPKQAWLRAVATRVAGQRPDIAPALLNLLGVEPLPTSDFTGTRADAVSPLDPLGGLGIEELSVCYEALLADLDRKNRRHAGQYFTPDDAAQFMVKEALGFEAGTWLDPCCGIGNLSWHLTAAQDDPGQFLRDSLTLVDRDEVALRSALVLIAAQFANQGDTCGVEAFFERARAADFLTLTHPPAADYAILNPPYARAEAPEGFTTAPARDLFAFFLEKVSATVSGFVAVTPAAYLAAPKYSSLRTLLDNRCGGGRVYVFDNVPDTLFRGFKFGSKNTSKTNFVRAAITVCDPRDRGWHTTPIIRWRAASRANMFAGAPSLLTDRQVGPDGEWAKIPAQLLPAWRRLRSQGQPLSALVTRSETPYRLDVATTPRYYISAAFRDLQRSSKTTLYFDSPEDRDNAAAVLNSSIPYFWWRALDGGVTLPRRVLMSVPVGPVPPEARQIVRQMYEDEGDHLVTKLNAGRTVENVKRPQNLVAALDRLLLPEAVGHLDVLYSPDMTSAAPSADGRNRGEHHSRNKPPGRSKIQSPRNPRNPSNPERRTP